MPRTKKQPKSFSSDFSFDQMPARARIRRHRYAHRVQFHPAPRGLLPYRFGQGPRADTARALRMGRGPCGQTPERAQRRLQTMKARRRCRSRRRPGAVLRTASASSRVARRWQGFQLPLPSCRSSASARGAIPSPFLALGRTCQGQGLRRRTACRKRRSACHRRRKWQGSGPARQDSGMDAVAEAMPEALKSEDLCLAVCGRASGALSFAPATCRTDAAREGRTPCRRGKRPALCRSLWTP